MKKLEDKFVPYEEALKLKELGFDEECFGYYTGDKMHLVIRPAMSRTNIPDSVVVTAPLWQDAFDWFREEHNLNNYIRFSKGFDFIDDFYEFIIKNEVSKNGFDTYKEVQLACLRKLIQIVEQQKEKS